MDSYMSQLMKFLKPSSVQCQDTSEQVSMYNPAFAELDPHLKFDDKEDEQESPMHPLQKRNLRLPPTFDSLLNNVKAVTKKVEHINGFKFQFSLGLSPLFNVMNSWHIPSQKPESDQAGGPMDDPRKKKEEANYALAVQYVGGQTEDLMRGMNPQIIMTGRMNSQGFLEGAIIQQFGERTTLRFNTHFSERADITDAQVMLDLDVQGDDWVSSVRAGSGMLSGNLMQTIGKNLVLGFQTMYLYQRRMSIMSYAAKYSHNRHHIYFQYIAPADLLTSAYSVQLKPRTHLISELNYSPSTGETTCILGYRQQFISSEVISTINSQGKISSVLNLQSPNQPHSLKLCAVADFIKDSYQFGYGFFVGNQ